MPHYVCSMEGCEETMPQQLHLLQRVCSGCFARLSPERQRELLEARKQGVVAMMRVIRQASADLKGRA
jgi:hypothetical protein